VNTDGDSARVTLEPLPPQPDPVKPCGGIENASAKFEYIPVGDKGGFLLNIPKCGQFALTANLNDYIMPGPSGETAPYDHALLITKSLCVQYFPDDQKGNFWRVHIDRGCGTESGGAVYLRRMPTYFLSFSDPQISNWALLKAAIDKRNAQPN
jgi:hypothetical protein